jgi:hypothetical protein
MVEHAVVVPWMPKYADRLCAAAASAEVRTGVHHDRPEDRRPGARERVSSCAAVAPAHRVDLRRVDAQVRLDQAEDVVD